MEHKWHLNSEPPDGEAMTALVIQCLRTASVSWGLISNFLETYCQDGTSEETLQVAMLRCLAEILTSCKNNTILVAALQTIVVISASGA